MMAAIFNSSILDSAILHKENFTHSFWLNLMMAAILNSAMLDSDTAILDSNTLLSSLRFTQKHSSSTLTLTQTNSIQLTRWWQPSWILPSWIQPFCTKKNFTHSFWLTLMMAAILNSAMLDSDTAILDSITLLSSIRFTQKHSYSTVTLTPTNSIWFNLMMTAILNSSILNSSDTILDSATFLHNFSHILTQTSSIWLKLIHSDSTWWWQQSWILSICIQPS